MLRLSKRCQKVQSNPRHKVSKRRDAIATWKLASLGPFSTPVNTTWTKMLVFVQGTGKGREGETRAGQDTCRGDGLRRGGNAQGGGDEGPAGDVLVAALPHVGELPACSILDGRDVPRK